MYPQKQFLAERFMITYVTTGRDILSWGTSVPASKEEVVITNPQSGELPGDSLLQKSVYPKPPPEPVPFYADQMKMLHDALPGARFETTEAALKACRGPLLLHILTHGFYVSKPSAEREPDRRSRQLSNSLNIPSIENPLLRSGFYLADAWSAKPGVEDGLHTALEASSLNLWGTKMVVLSACESGLGDPVTAEGVFGLRRALILAGAQSQLVSLWRVNGDPTLEFMREYYKALRRGLNGATALTEVQRALLNQPRYAHPYNWAGFVFVGRRVSIFPRP
jgi:hypothetical protein